MADYTAQRKLAKKQSLLTQGKLKSDYDAYLGQLAQQFGLSQESLASNLEARGIIRSGEAGTAVTRLGAMNETNITNAGTDYTYNKNTETNNLAAQLAALKSGKAAPAATPPAATPPVKKVIPDAIGPTNIGGGKTYSNTGLYGAVYPTPSTVKPRPIRDAVPRAPRPPVTGTRPGTVNFNPINPRFR